MVNMVAAGLVLNFTAKEIQFDEWYGLQHSLPAVQNNGDDKHDLEVYIEDLIDYCIMQNWLDPNWTEAARWTKEEKAMACLRASLSPAARAVYKYNLHDYLNRIIANHTWLSTLWKSITALASGSRGKGKNSFPCWKTKRNPSRLGRQGFAIKLPSVSTKISLINWWEISLSLD